MCHTALCLMYSGCTAFTRMQLKWGDFQTVESEFETKVKDENNNSLPCKIKSPKVGHGGNIHWHSVD